MTTRSARIDSAWVRTRNSFGPSRSDFTCTFKQIRRNTANGLGEISKHTKQSQRSQDCEQIYSSRFGTFFTGGPSRRNGNQTFVYKCKEENQLCCFRNGKVTCFSNPQTSSLTFTIVSVGRLSKGWGQQVPHSVVTAIVIVLTHRASNSLLRNKLMVAACPISTLGSCGTKGESLCGTKAT